MQPIDHATVELAYDVAEAAFRHVWHDQFVTWTVVERIQVVLQGLKRDLPQSAFDEVVRLHEEMETTIAPDTRRLVQLTVEPGDDTHQVLDMLLAKKRASERRSWLETNGNLAEV